MAKTFRKEQLSVTLLQEPMLQYAVRTTPEGASQTYVAGAPVVLTSGLIVEAANPVTDVFAFALKAGQNLASGALAKILPVIDGLILFANFLASGGADNVLAAADVGGSFRLVKGAYGFDGSTIWAIEDTGTTTAVKIVSLESDQTLPNVADSRPAAGDTNARVCAIVLDAVRSFD